MSPTPKVVECPVSPGEDPHVPAGTRVVRPRAGMLEGGSLTGRFYQGPSSLPQVVFSHHNCPTREVWKQGTFYSTRNANVLSNEVATKRKQPLIFACLRWDGDHTSCFLQRRLHLVVPGQWSAAWNRHHAHTAWDHRQSGCIMLSRRASRRYSGSLGVVKVSMGDPFQHSSFEMGMLQGGGWDMFMRTRGSRTSTSGAGGFLWPPSGGGHFQGIHGKLGRVLPQSLGTWPSSRWVSCVCRLGCRICSVHIGMF